MAFEKKIWLNVPDENNPPPIPEGQDALCRFDADNMNRIEEGIDGALPKEGGVVTGDIYSVDDSSRDNLYITKKYIKDFIYYLNNESEVNLQRYENGELRELNRNLSLDKQVVFTHKGDGTSESYEDIILENCCSFNFVKPQPCKSPLDLLDIEVTISNGSFKGDNIIEISNSKGDIVLEESLPHDVDAYGNLRSNVLAGNFKWSDMAEGTYYITFRFKNVQLNSSYSEIKIPNYSPRFLYCKRYMINFE